MFTKFDKWILSRTDKEFMLSLIGLVLVVGVAIGLLLGMYLQYYSDIDKIQNSLFLVLDDHTYKIVEMNMSESYNMTNITEVK